MEDQTNTTPATETTSVEAATARVETARQSEEQCKIAATDLRRNITEKKQFLADCKSALKDIPNTEENAQHRAAGEKAVADAQSELDQLQTQLKETTELKKSWADEKKAANAALREARKADKAAPRPKVEREERNGQLRPDPEGISGRAWAIFDEVSASKGSPAAYAEVEGPGMAAGIKQATVRAAYSHWRKFHGISGRIMSAEQEAEQKRKAEEKAAADAAKEAAKTSAEGAGEAA